MMNNCPPSESLSLRLHHRVMELFHSSERIRFLIIGGYNTLFGYFSFAALYFLLWPTIHYLVIMVVSHLLSVVNAFVGHRWLVFRSRGPLLLEFLRFNLSFLGLLGFGMVAMPFLVEMVGMRVLIAQALLTTVVVVSSYFAHRHFSFKKAA